MKQILPELLLAPGLWTHCSNHRSLQPTSRQGQALGKQGPWLAGWLAEALPDLSQAVPMLQCPSPAWKPRSYWPPRWPWPSRPHCWQVGAQATPGRLVKEAHSPHGFTRPPVLLQYLGKYQVPGLKTSGALGPQKGRSLKPKTNLTSSTNSPPDLNRESNVIKQMFPSFICQ